MQVYKQAQYLIRSKILIYLKLKILKILLFILTIVFEQSLKNTRLLKISPEIKGAADQGVIGGQV